MTRVFFCEQCQKIYETDLDPSYDFGIKSGDEDAASVCEDCFQEIKSFVEKYGSSIEFLRGKDRYGG